MVLRFGRRHERVQPIRAPVRDYMARKHVKQERFARRAELWIRSFISRRSVALVVRGKWGIEVRAVASTSFIRILWVTNGISKAPRAYCRSAISVYRPGSLNKEMSFAAKEVRDSLSETAPERKQSTDRLFQQAGRQRG